MDHWHKQILAIKKQYKVMLHPQMRNLYSTRYICKDVITRHALRQTCKRLHEWITKDKVFIARLGTLSGTRIIIDDDTEVVIRCIIRRFNANSYNVPSMPMRRAVRFYAMDIAHQNGYLVTTDNVLELALNIQNRYIVLLEVVVLLFGDNFNVLKSIITNDTWKRLFEWKIGFDSASKRITVTRTDI